MKENKLFAWNFCFVFVLNLHFSQSFYKFIKYYNRFIFPLLQLTSLRCGPRQTSTLVRR